MPLHPEGPEHRTERQVQVQQHRALLDVQLQVGRGVIQLDPAVLHFLEVNAHRLERVGQRDALLVPQPARLGQVERPRARRRAEQALAETRAFLVRPVDQPHGDGWPARILFADPPQNLHAGQHVQAAVEPAPVRHRVHVSADEQRPLAGAGQGRPEIPRGIRMGLDRQPRELRLQPGAGLHPHGRERHALRAVLVAGQGAQFLELGDGALGVQRHGWARVGDSPTMTPECRPNAEPFLATKNTKLRRRVTLSRRL